MASSISLVSSPSIVKITSSLKSNLSFVSTSLTSSGKSAIDSITSSGNLGLNPFA